jgi:hypothetical protein
MGDWEGNFLGMEAHWRNSPRFSSTPQSSPLPSQDGKYQEKMVGLDKNNTNTRCQRAFFDQEIVRLLGPDDNQNGLEGKKAHRERKRVARPSAPVVK